MKQDLTVSIVFFKVIGARGYLASGISFRQLLVGLVAQVANLEFAENTGYCEEAAPSPKSKEKNTQQ